MSLGHTERSNDVGKSTNGPDATDVMVMISALEALHECRVSLTVTASTQGHNGTGTIVLLVKWERLPDSPLVKSVTTKTDWPNGHGRSFWGEMMNLLYVADFMISEVYQQRFLPV